MRSKLDLFSTNEKTNPLVHLHSYDYNENRTKRYDSVHAANSELYTYDNLGQIKTLNRGVLNNDHTSVTTVNHSESWDFDKTGNWSQYTNNSNTENRNHNAANELQGIATHDANGNMVLMPGLKGKYDAWNRLVEVRDTSDNLIASYEYNGLNQRIKKTIDSTVTKSFFNENWQEVESQTNSQVTSYVWGLRYIDDLILREKGEERLYSLADPNWNIVAICDVNGDIQERYIYDTFGRRNIFDEDFTEKIDTEFNWNRSFTGQILDIETGLILYRNRYYHTGLGRFVIRDPIGYNAEDVNIYRYIINNTLLNVDPMGNSPVAIACAGACGASIVCVAPGAIACAANTSSFGEFTTCMDIYRNELPAWERWTCGAVSGGCLYCLFRQVIKIVNKNKCKILSLAKTGACTAAAGAGSCTSGRSGRCKCGYSSEGFNTIGGLWAACSSARAAYTYTCFKPGTSGWDGHIKQIKDTARAAEKCFSCAIEAK
ncbi:MAG: RHS repeat-associated core domain-containing protein [Planctomycetaceae bacterium]|jgi:RHS repeat-associated protein|nr:RHS repeat-associated core domain-containing protein [Planctomycetaceae bacterium]